jgi:hypothetical protein
MQFDVNIRLYEYWHEQVKIRKKRWNNKEIKTFYWKYICKQKVRKRGGGGGKSVPRAPVLTTKRIIYKLDINRVFPPVSQSSTSTYYS